MVDLNLNNIALFAVLGSLFAFYKQVQGFILKVLSIFIRRDEACTSVLGRGMLRKILSQSKIIRWGNVKWDFDEFMYSLKHEAHIDIITRQETSLFVLYKNKIPLILSPAPGDGIKITYLYKTFDFDKLAAEINEEYIQNYKKALSVNREFYCLEDVIGTEVSLGGNQSKDDSYGQLVPRTNASVAAPSSFPQVPFSFHVLEDYNKFLLDINYKNLAACRPDDESSFYWSKEALKLSNELNYLIENISWFRERNIKFARGFLLKGKPGGGKSVMIREIAMKLKIPVRRFHLGTLSDAEFLKRFPDCPYRYCINLIEDVDSVFDGRENKLNHSSMLKNLVSFDTLINAIAGVKQNTSGIFTIITTNNPEKIDEALLRSGRLDVHLEIPELCREGREFVIKNIMRDWPEIWEEMINKTEGMMAAEVENTCIDEAFNRKMAEIKLL